MSTTTKRPFSDEIAKRAQLSSVELKAALDARVRSGSLVLPTDPEQRKNVIGRAILEVLYERYLEEQRIEEAVST